MRPALSLLAVILLDVLPSHAQTATDLNEGVRATPGAQAGDFLLSWWGRSGRTYFIQQSYDLINWQYVPAVCSGADAVDGMNFSCSDPRQFWRLRHTNASTGLLTAEEADFDGDGVSNIDELNASIDPFNNDTDGDHYGDGIEMSYHTDPGSSASIPSLNTSDFEHAGQAPAVSLMGYIKNVNNDWTRSKSTGQPEIASGYVSWGDNAGHQGSEPYTIFEPRWSSKYSSLVYPPLATSSLGNYGFVMRGLAMGRSLPGTTPGIDATFAHAELAHFQTQIGSTNGQPVPWDIYSKLLTYKTSRPWNGSTRTYTSLQFEKFFIKQGNSLSEKKLLLEPGVDIGLRNEHWIGIPDLHMNDWTKTASYDTITHTFYSTPWIMLPVNETREIALWHNVGEDATMYLKAQGPGFTPAGIFEVDASTPYAFSSRIVGDKGFLRIGVGNPGETSPLMTPDDQSLETDFQHLVRFTVKPKRQLLVVIHPICLATKDENDDVYPGPLPQYLPSSQTIENYLNSIFEVQANVHVTVEMRNEVQLLWDVGMGADTVPDQSDLGLGNGALDCYHNATFGGQKISDEEAFIFLNAPPDSRTGINLYYMVTPNGGVSRGWLSEYNEMASEMDNLSQTAFLGYAGPAYVGHVSKAVFVLDRAATSTDAGVLWCMAHELGHGVGKLDHTCGSGLEWANPNNMPGSDNEKRLMTGRIGPKRGAGPKQMIKYEWDQISNSSNVQRP